MKYIHTIKMDVDEFIKITGNPAQRNTAHHAKQAVKTHLGQYHESHLKVAIAVCGNTRWKTDGHTRAFLWDNGELTAPKFVYVDVWEVKNKEEAVNLYETYDSRFALETTADMVSGALRLMGIDNANKSFSRNTGIRSATVLINKLTGKYKPDHTTAQNLMLHKKEIKKLIDQQWAGSPNPSHRKPGIPSCAVAAFIITYKIYKDECLGFWDGFYNGKGVGMFKSGRDGSLAAAEWVIRARKNKELLGMDNPKNIMAILNAFNYYWDEEKVNDIRLLYKKDFKQSDVGRLRELVKDMGYF